MDNGTIRTSCPLASGFCVAQVRIQLRRNVIHKAVAPSTRKNTSHGKHRDRALFETDPTSLNDGCIVRSGDLTPERFAVRTP